ncbi:hypothetical protein E2C01_050470 [Portunus trituberculatus]|uniref:Uncharacterized protein n=1 Tax=Portunus trituberculatus TaxID=210409 RepID=A0A5B7G8D0_PORTR|nr:hypothetical protein [Portunus trituberculatus]
MTPSSSDMPAAGNHNPCDRRDYIYGSSYLEFFLCNEYHNEVLEHPSYDEWLTNHNMFATNGMTMEI